VGFRFFRADLCTYCGLCFEHCPVLHLPLEEAIRDIEALVRGDTNASLAYQRCTTCNTCDLICPVQANPYELILERWGEESQARGLPAIASFVFPNEPGNMWASIRALMAEDELSLVRSWRENMANSRKVVLLTGFYTNLIPYIAMTSLLDELKPAIAGFEGLWGCAGDIYKLGMISASEEIGNMLRQKFSDMGIEKLYCFMGAEAMMLSDVLPNRFGIDFSFCHPEPLDYWILDKLNSRQIQVKRKLNMKVAVHDNCCSKYMGGKLQQVTRQTMQRIGCEVMEMRHNKESAFCCGWGATIPTLHGPASNNPSRTLLYMLDSLYRRLQEAETTGAEVMVVSCDACYIFLSVIKVLTHSKMDIYLSQELVQMAAGETPQHRNDRRAWDMVALFTNVLFRRLFTIRGRKRFYPKPVKMEPVLQLDPGDTRRIKLFGKIFHSVLIQNPVTRRLISATVKVMISFYRSSLERKQRKLIRSRMK
jgi:Fe-S oxidoreductase